MTYEPIAEDSFFPSSENISRAIKGNTVQLICYKDIDNPKDIYARSKSDHVEAIIDQSEAADFIAHCNNWDAEGFSVGGIDATINAANWQYWLEGYEVVN